MFGLQRLFSVIGRLTSALTTTAEIVEGLNAQLVERLTIRDEPAQIAAPAAEVEEPATNGRQRKVKV